MNWEHYANSYREVALKEGFDEHYVNRCLTYARSLFQKNLPVIYDQLHFALLVGYDLSYILGATNEGRLYYRFFTVPKKSGGERQIAEPLPSLKEIQRWILDNILYSCTTSKFAKGFVPQLSIRDNAKFHRKQRLVLSLDIKDFFPSIKFPRVYSFFHRLGYRNSVSGLLTKLCTLDDYLPQGAPTSPALSNLICLRLDRRLAGYALKNKLRYTRYADDITISGEFSPSKIIWFVKMVLADERLELNEDKTRLMESHQCQEVTGIVVNEKLQAPRSKRRELRQAIFYIQKYGLNSHLVYKGINKANYVKHLMGIANFLLFVNPKDREVKKALRILRQLL